MILVYPVGISDSAVILWLSYWNKLVHTNQCHYRTTTKWSTIIFTVKIITKTDEVGYIELGQSLQQWGGKWESNQANNNNNWSNWSFHKNEQVEAYLWCKYVLCRYIPASWNQIGSCLMDPEEINALWISKHKNYTKKSVNGSSTPTRET